MQVTAGGNHHFLSKADILRCLVLIKAPSHLPFVLSATVIFYLFFKIIKSSLREYCVRCQAVECAMFLHSIAGAQRLASALSH